ncbi:MAG: universal stress protein [Burkholderiales bacterium]
MSYKTLLVHLDSGARCPVRVELAISLARRFDAYLVGVNALTAVRIPGYVSAEAGDTFRQAQERTVREQAAESEAAFRRAVGQAGLPQTEWRNAAADALDAVTLHARYADLVVIGQPDDASGVDRGFAGRLVLGAGRPILVVPFAGEFRTLGKRVLVAWNAGPEATRAVTDAIPLLRQAEAVQVLAFNPSPGPHGAMPGTDIGLYLARHGVRIEVNEDYNPDIDVGNEILSRAADLGSDLIVMGAYGHSRLQQLIMGGATRTILESMTVPVLMSH